MTLSQYRAFICEYPTGTKLPPPLACQHNWSCLPKPHRKHQIRYERLPILSNTLCNKNIFMISWEVNQTEHFTNDNSVYHMRVDKQQINIIYHQSNQHLIIPLPSPSPFYLSSYHPSIPHWPLFMWQKHTNLGGKFSSCCFFNQW